MVLYNADALLNTLAIYDADNVIVTTIVMSDKLFEGKASYITVTSINENNEEVKCFQYAVYETKESVVKEANTITEILSDYYDVKTVYHDISELYD